MININLDLSIFDIVGPVMLGPSSSGTAGMMRIGAAARQFLDGDLKKVRILFHERNRDHYEGCCSHIALVGGLLGFSADDERFPEALMYAQKEGIEVTIDFFPASVSPDMLRVELVLETITGCIHRFAATSVGGGNIRVEAIDGCEVNLSNYSPYLFAYGSEGILAYRKLTGDKEDENQAAVELGAMPGVVRLLKTDAFFQGGSAGTMPLFTEFSELTALCEKEDIDIAEVMIRYELLRSGKSREEVMSRMQNMWQVIKKSVAEGLPGNYRPIMGLDDGQNGKRVIEALKEGRTMSGDITAKATAYALAAMEYAVSMGCIVATPTCGSAGVVPGVLVSLYETYGFSEEEMVKTLFAMTSIGVVMAYDGIRFSGCAAGCQGEMTVSAAMASMGAAYLGLLRAERSENFPKESAKVTGNAAAFAIKGLLGLVCDPVAGVEVPCIKRNVSAAMAALGCADMALAGVESYLTPDETSAALKDVQDHLPEYLRGGGGGCAACCGRR